MNPSFLPFFLTEILREAPGEGGSAGADGGNEGGTKTAAAPSTMFRREAAQGTQPGADGAAGGDGVTPPAAQSKPGEKPEWLMEKYLVNGADGTLDLAASMQKQAEGYRDLYGKFSTKTDALRAEVLKDAVAEYGKTIGVPDTPDAYEYPEGVTPPDEAIDAALRTWAKDNAVSPDGFKALVNDVWMQTQANYEAELGKLGKNAEDRLSKVSEWVVKNVDEAHFGAVERLMTTAEGVELVEHLMGRSRDAGYAPEGGGAPAPVLTRAAIREAQADPKFGTDPDYTARVRGMWAKYAALPADKQK